MYRSLNQKQASVFYGIREWCLNRVRRQGLETPPFFYYVNGGAGTGKSHLIKCIHAEASKILGQLRRFAEEPDISKHTVVLSAFTGTAAFNISGGTLHSIFKLPRSLMPPFQGLGNKLDEVRAELLNVEILVIDEVSMVSKALFAYVDARLKQIKGTSRPFGGVSVLAVGDFYQLPPVRQSKPLCVYDPSQLDLWRGNFQMITLTDVMRQKDDVPFANFLNRIRVKVREDALTPEDRELISGAITDSEHCPKDMLFIYATNKEVNAHNLEALAFFHTEIVTIDADDYRRSLTTHRMERHIPHFKGTKNDLPDSIQIALGARVMITRNIDVQSGLCNGTFGKVSDIVTDALDKTHVSKIGIELETGRSGSAKIVYIQREENNLKQKGAVRQQFPIKLAFAVTAHKTQGMTIPAAAVSLKKIFEHGMAYVALSRVTSLSGLHIIDMAESKIYANPEITESLNSMTEASFGHIMPLLSAKNALHIDSLTVIHHNTEGLPSRLDDIRHHHELTLADVLCLTETRLSFVGDNLKLEGYGMFFRNRNVSYTNYPELAAKDGGGVAIYAKERLRPREVRYIHNIVDMEFVVVQLEAPIGMLIAAVYRPPSFSVPAFLKSLGGFLDGLEICGPHPIVVCGDFNEDQLNPHIRKPILELFNSKGYTQLVTTATTEKYTALDLIFISRPERCLNWGVCRTYYSYHNPVYSILSME